MFFVYLLLGGLFSWLAIKPFCEAFSNSAEDQHMVDENSNFDDSLEENDWEDEESLDSGDDHGSEEDRRGEFENESTNDWCTEELIEGVE